MLSISLADAITENDPCTPGSPSYNPSDPICALTAADVAADTGTEITFEPTGTFRTSCPPGYALTNGVCIASVQASMTQAQAASLSQAKMKQALMVVGAIGAVGGAAYFISRRMSKRRS